MLLPLAVFLSTLVSSSVALKAVGTPFGYASGVTGGGDRTPVIPKDIKELASLLADSTPRVILLDKLYDFIGSEGTEYGKICKPYTCTNNVQLYIDTKHRFCGTNPLSDGSWDKAGTTALQVGPNKTVLGKGTSGWIRGKGLYIQSNNVIVQNIKITNINEKYVWGGDAITINGADGVWIDHVYINAIGRQYIVTGFNTSKRVTLSNNKLDGAVKYSPGCNGAHYWTILLAGDKDQITFALNYIVGTSGRGPHIGGLASDIRLHAYNNFWHHIPGHAFDLDKGSRSIIEGNVMQDVQNPITALQVGAGFAPFSSSEAAQCKAILGRNCLVNSLSSSGTLRRVDAYAIQIGTDSGVKNTLPMDQSKVAAYVLANAGVGKVNVAKRRLHENELEH